MGLTLVSAGDLFLAPPPCVDTETHVQFKSALFQSCLEPF